MTQDNTKGQNVVKLEQILVRDIWDREDTNFTPWLADNISRLSEKIDMELSVIECEKSVGPFSADIYAEDEKGNKVIIENQLERTDHDHLGKMLTYAAGLKGKTMIWIADKARPEHTAAINWLNTMNTDIRFYLLELIAHRIDEKNVTMDFNVVCEPNDMTKAIKVDNESSKIKTELHKKFWTQLKVIDAEYDDMYSESNNLKPGFLECTIIPGAGWTLNIRKNFALAQFYIYDNKELYELLKEHKDEIEADFGEPLNWINNENHKAARIVSLSKIGGLNDTDKWDEIQHDLVDRMSRLTRVIGKYLE